LNVRNATTMKICLKINDFQPLDGETANAENPPKDNNSEHYRVVKMSHSAKAITKAKKLYRYSSLDISFPTFVKNENEQKFTTRISSKSEPDLSNEDRDKAKDDFYFEANFDEAEAAHTDHYFEAIFEDDCEDNVEDINDTKANLPTGNDSNKGDSRPCTPSTVVSSSSSGELSPSAPGASVASSTSAEDLSLDANMNKAAKKTILGKKKSPYYKLDCSSSVDLREELNLRLEVIHKLKDATIEQSKKIEKIQLAHKASKILLNLFRKEIAYLPLQNVGLKERVAKIEDDLRMAKDGAVVTEKEANRMFMALVLIHEEINGIECQVVNLDDDFEVEDLFAVDKGGETLEFSGCVLPGRVDGVEDKWGGSDPIASEDSDIEFDAFGLYEKDREVEVGSE